MITTIADELLIYQLCEHQPEAIAYVKPILGKEPNEENRIIDFRLHYCNPALEQIFNQSRKNLLGKSILEDKNINPETKRLLLQHCSLVMQTGVPMEFSYFNKHLNKYLNISRVKVNEGVLITTRDRTSEYRILEELKSQVEFSNLVLETSIRAIYALEATFNTLGEIIDFRYKRINKKFSYLIKKPPEQVIDSSYLHLFPESRTNGFFDHLCSVIETGISLQGEVFALLESEGRWFEYNIIRLGENSLVVTYMDISEQRKTAMDLEQEKSLLDNILKYSPSGIAVSKVIRDEANNVKDGIIILTNNSAVQFTGIPYEIMLSKSSGEIDPNFLTSTFFQNALKTLQTGKSFTQQYYLNTTGKWLEVSVAKMNEEHLLYLFTDVSSLKKTQIELEKLVEELKRSNESLQEFAFAASHDLKEPIRKIHYFSDRLKQKLGTQLNPENTKIIDKLMTATQRMQSLIDDLLEFAQLSLQAGKQEEVNLNELIKIVQEDLELKIKEKSATLAIGQLPILYGNKRQLQQLFQNLMDNALKYCFPSTCPFIIINATVINILPQKLSHPKRVYGQYHLLEIIDNGIGFEQCEAERIFNVFQRLHGNSEYKGNGVGLAIARKVVENHNGFIIAEGRPGAGAVFKIYFPMDRENNLKKV